MKFQERLQKASRRHFLSAVSAAATAVGIAGCGGGGSGSGFAWPIDQGGQMPPPPPPPAPPPPAPPPPAQAVGRWGEATIIGPSIPKQTGYAVSAVKTSAAGRFISVAWTQGAQVWVRTYETEKGWGAPFNATPNIIESPLFALEIAQHASGNLALAWVSGSNELRQHVYLVIVGPGTVPDATRVSEDATEIRSLALAIDERGAAVVAWGVQQNFPESARTVWTASLSIDGVGQDGARFPLPAGYDSAVFTLSRGSAPQVALAMHLRSPQTREDTATVVHYFDSTTSSWSAPQQVEGPVDGKRAREMCMAFANEAYSLASLRSRADHKACEIRVSKGGRTGWSGHKALEPEHQEAASALRMETADGRQTLLAWTQYDLDGQANNKVMYATGQDILSLSSAVPVDPTAGEDTLRGCAAVGTGAIGAWVRGSDGPGGYSIVVSANDGDGWEPALVADRLKASPQSVPECAAIADFALVAWRQARDDDTGLDDIWVIERTYGRAG